MDQLTASLKVKNPLANVLQYSFIRYIFQLKKLFFFYPRNLYR